MRNFSDRENVGITRLLFFGLLSLFLPFQILTDAAIVPVWQHCNYREIYWPWPALDSNAAYGLSILLRVSLMTSALGILTTISYWSAFVCLSVLMLNWTPYCFSTHELTPLPIAILLWALLDRDSGFRLERFFSKSGSAGSVESPLTRLLIPAQRLHFVLIFFSSGFSKFVNGGLRWIQDPTLKDILVVQNFFFENSRMATWLPEINHWLTGSPSLCIFLSILVLLLETLAPLAFFYRWAAILIIPSLLLMQIGIGITLYIVFLGWLALYVFWLPGLGLQTRKTPRILT